MKTDAEIQVMMDEMKAEGKSSQEIGWAVTEAIYGHQASAMEVTLFMEATAPLLVMSPEGSADYEFTLGSRNFIKETYPEVVAQ